MQKKANNIKRLLVLLANYYVILGGVRVTSSESLLFHNHEAKCIQGLFLTVASKVSDWKKGLVLARWNQPLLQPIFERDALEIGIYERFPIESW